MADGIASPVEARSASAQNAANRMIRIKRSQATIAEEFAKLSPVAPDVVAAEAARLARRSRGAHHAEKRHHGDVLHAAKRAGQPTLEELNAQERALLPNVNELLWETGLGQLAKRSVETLTTEQKRALSLFPGLQNVLNQVYPGLNGAVTHTENTITGTVDRLDKILTPPSTGTVTGSPDPSLLQKVNKDLLLPLFHSTNGVVVNGEQAVNGAVDGLGKVLKREEAEKRDNLPLITGINNLVSEVTPNVNNAGVAGEAAVLGAVQGLNEILQKRATPATNPGVTSPAPDNTVQLTLALQQLLQRLVGTGSPVNLGGILGGQGTHLNLGGLQL
ncbi:hypothetical protein JCM10295v2_004416 [Rhodotorula toruloides]